MSDPVIFVTLRKRAADKGLDNGGNSLMVIYVYYLQGLPYIFVTFPSLVIQTQTLKVQLRSLASDMLLRGFRGFHRGTISLCSSKGYKIMGRQRLGKVTKIYGGPCKKMITCINCKLNNQTISMYCTTIQC